MSLELGRFLEQRRGELGLSRRDVAERSGLSYPYVSQLETGDRDPALKAMRVLAPVLDVPVEELASMVAGGSWVGASYGSDAFADTGSPRMGLMSLPPSGTRSDQQSEPSGPRSREKVMLSLERRLRDVPPLERIAILNELIAHALAEVEAER